MIASKKENKSKIKKRAIEIQGERKTIWQSRLDETLAPSSSLSLTRRLCV
jgi:hypothetical protein